MTWPSANQQSIPLQLCDALLPQTLHLCPLPAHLYEGKGPRRLCRSDRFGLQVSAARTLEPSHPISRLGALSGYWPRVRTHLKVVLALFPTCGAVQTTALLSTLGLSTPSFSFGRGVIWAYLSSFSFHPSHSSLSLKKETRQAGPT